MENIVMQTTSVPMFDKFYWTATDTTMAIVILSKWRENCRWIFTFWEITHTLVNLSRLLRTSGRWTGLECRSISRRIAKRPSRGLRSRTSSWTIRTSSRCGVPTRPLRGDLTSARSSSPTPNKLWMSGSASSQPHSANRLTFTS